MEDVLELPKQYLKTEKLKQDQWLGIWLMLPQCQRTGTGEMLMELTLLDGARTNIFHNIVDHAGLKDLLQLLETDSIFYFKEQTQHLLT